MGEVLKIDINCDVGEGVGNEADIMPLISSCNIACGGHAGNQQTMRSTIAIAKLHKVKIGAHPSYPDKLNFGRKPMDLSSDALINSLKDQLENFTRILQEENGVLHHIKPHGALYNEIARNEGLAHVFLDAIDGFGSVPLYVPFASQIQRVAKERGISIILEAFADRNYADDLSLVSRTNEDALIKEPKEVLDHILRIVQEGRVLTIEKRSKKLSADTFCIHGDTPSALEILMYLHRELPNHNIQVKT